MSEEARTTMDFVEAQARLAEAFPLEVLEAFDACVREISRAVVLDVLREQRGSPAFEAFADEVMRHITVNVGAPVEYNTAPANNSIP